MSQKNPQEIINAQAQELTTLKVKVYDLNTMVENLQNSLNLLAQASGFTGNGSIQELAQHIHEGFNPPEDESEPKKKVVTKRKAPKK